MNHLLFPTHINQGTIVPSDQQFNDTYQFLTDAFDQCNGGWALETGVSTSELDGGAELFNNPLFDWLTNPLLLTVRDYWNNTVRYRKDFHLYIESMWANRHREGDTTGLHAHIGGGRSKSHVSCVYYFQKQLNGGQIQFENPLQQIHRMCPLDKEYDDWARTDDGELYDFYTLDTQTFDYIIFPSWLRHRTLPYHKEERIAISVNISGYPIDPTEGDFLELK